MNLLVQRPNGHCVRTRVQHILPRPQSHPFAFIARDTGTHFACATQIAVAGRATPGGIGITVSSETWYRFGIDIIN